jgi:hypothetical protein
MGTRITLQVGWTQVEIYRSGIQGSGIHESGFGIRDSGFEDEGFGIRDER